MVFDKGVIEIFRDNICTGVSQKGVIQIFRDNICARVSQIGVIEIFKRRFIEECHTNI